MTLEKTLYSASVEVEGGRTGSANSEDGRLKLSLSTPQALGGDDGPGSNPEQLFAAGYAACFIGAMKHVAASQNLTLSGDPVIRSKVDIGPIPAGFGIAVQMEIDVPGLDQQAAEKLVEAAHQVCPYSNATRGNIDISLTARAV